MKTFDVQSIELSVARQTAFAFIADPATLPRWTSAFATVTGNQARLCTPNGEVEIILEVRASVESGTIDWLMTFPDGNLATAYSRVVEINRGCCVYSFVLTPPPVPLEFLEGALASQSVTLAAELGRLKALLESEK